MIKYKLFLKRSNKSQPWKNSEQKRTPNPEKAKLTQLRLSLLTTLRSLDHRRRHSNPASKTEKRWNLEDRKQKHNFLKAAAVYKKLQKRLLRRNKAKLRQRKEFSAQHWAVEAQLLLPPDLGCIVKIFKIWHLFRSLRMNSNLVSLLRLGMTFKIQPL